MKSLVSPRTSQLAGWRLPKSAPRKFSRRLGPLGAALILGLVAIGAWLPAAAVAQSPNAVTLLYFRAAVQGNSVHLTWQTGSEVDNGGFQLWRSDQDNDPGRGVLLEEFPPQGDVAGAFYEYTDTDVELNRTYYYTLVAFDTQGNEDAYPSDPRAVTVGQAQPPATATPTATATTAAPTPTATPTAPTAPQQNPSPTTPSAATPAFSTPPSQAATATPVPTQSTPPSGLATATPAPTATAQQAPVGQPEAPSPTAQSEVSTDTPPPPAASSGFADSPLLPTPLPAVSPANQTAPQPAATVQPPAVTLVAPDRAPRPTPTPRPAADAGQSTGGPRALLAVIAGLAIAAAAVLVGLIIVVLLRARGGS